MNTYIPEGYKSLLGVYDTQKAIGLLKRLFEDQLAANSKAVVRENVPRRNW